MSQGPPNPSPQNTHEGEGVPTLDFRWISQCKRHVLLWYANQPALQPIQPHPLITKTHKRETVLYAFQFSVKWKHIISLFQTMKITYGLSLLGTTFFSELYFMNSQQKVFNVVYFSEITAMWTFRNQTADVTDLLPWQNAFSACDVRQTIIYCGIFSASISCILLLQMLFGLIF